MKQILDRLSTLRRARAAEPSITNPQQLAEVYWDELHELLDQGEISASIARRLIADIFEAGSAGEPRSVKARIWQIHVEQQRSVAAANARHHDPER